MLAVSCTLYCVLSFIDDTSDSSLTTLAVGDSRYLLWADSLWSLIIDGYDMKIYLAVPIIANRELEKAKALAKVICDLGHELTSTWVVSSEPDYTQAAAKVFKRDLDGVKNSDLLVAEVSHGSHGVGMEIMAAYLHGKRVILLSESKARVSHMLEGVPNTMLIRYESTQDMILKMISAINTR